MSRIDEIYISKAREIQTQGYLESQAGHGVRPIWEDGSSAQAIYLPQQIFTYAPGETPLLSLRRIAWKTAIKEILWIYQDRNNDVNLLKEKYNVHYWDEWRNEAGNLGTAYGYQIGKTFRSPETGEPINQIERLLTQLKENPLNRRLLTTMIDVDDMSEMTLIPCAFMTMWTVTGNHLNLTLIQRSGDFLAAAAPGGINAIQYYALLLMVAQVSGYQPGQFVHFIQNLHIYERHLPQVEQIIQLPLNQLSNPKLKLNPDVHDFQDFTIQDFTLEDYHPNEDKYDIEIAL
ncbi:MAG: thymidylate synthase [Tissierellia bacterium]|nr:thymidylate synthase [Tissierellia bacterium]